MDLTMGTLGCMMVILKREQRGGDPLLRLHAECSLILGIDAEMFGPGAMELLERVEQTHSLHMACQKMGMSYTKGWKMIKRMEDILHFSVMTRTVGGASGGGSALTEKGAKLLSGYRAIEKDVCTTMEQSFKKNFCDWLEDV